MSTVPVDLVPGSPAPDFTLNSTPDGEPVTLSDLRGQPVILAFYPADFSPTCGDQLALYNEVLPEFERYGARLLAISVDNLWSHKAYAASKNLAFPLLADFHPKGAVGALYGTYDETTGQDSRDLFVIDGAGVIRWIHRSPRRVNPGAAGILAALEALANGEDPAP